MWGGGSVSNLRSAHNASGFGQSAPVGELVRTGYSNCLTRLRSGAGESPSGLGRRCGEGSLCAELGLVKPKVGKVKRRTERVEGVLNGTAKDLALTSSGEQNPGVLLRSGRGRHVVADADGARHGPGRDVNAIAHVLHGRQNPAHGAKVIAWP